MRLKSGLRAVRVAVAVLAVGALVGTTAACGDDDGGGSGDGGPVTLRFTWWGNADRAALTEQAIDKFEAKHTNIKIETSYAEFNAYWEKMATQIAGGSGPDILQMDYRYVREYADRNVLAELKGVDTAKMNQGLLNGGKVNGKTYAIPMGQNTQTLLYDPAVWQAAGTDAPKDGWTWANLEAGAKKVSAASGNKVKGITTFGQVEDWYEVWLRQQGKTLYTDDGKLGYTAADVTKFWEFSERLRKAGATPPAEETAKMDGSQANSPLAKKTSSAEFNYDSVLTANSWQTYGRELALMPFPSDSADLGQYAKPSMLISVARRSEHPKEAGQFIDFILNDAEVGKLLGTSRGMPVNSDVRAAVGGALTGPTKVTFEYETAILTKLKDAPAPPPKGAGTIKSAFQRVYDDVMFGRSTPQAAADKFMKEAEQALGK